MKNFHEQSGKWFLLVIISITSISLQAQLSIGVVGGLNESKVLKSNPELAIESNFLRGYFIGVKPSYKISENLSGVAEIQFSQKGTDLNNPTMDNESSSLRFSYIDILPGVEYSLFKSLSVGAGMNFGILTDTKFMNEDTDWTRLDGEKGASSFDLGGYVSVVAEIQGFMTFVRYNHGFLSARSIEATDEQGATVGEQKQYNQNFQVGIGYTFQAL